MYTVFILILYSISSVIEFENSQSSDDLYLNLQGGVVYSNKVVVMSSIYSEGRIIQGLGHGLEPTLASHK